MRTVMRLSMVLTVLVLWTCGEKAEQVEKPVAAKTIVHLTMENLMAHLWREAEAGDWARYTKTSGGTSDDITYRVVQRGSQSVFYEVTTQVDGDLGEIDSREVFLVEKDALDFRKQSGITEEKISVGGKEITCQKVTLQIGKKETTIWASSLIKAGGVVKVDDGDSVMTLVEYGSGG